MAQRKRPDELTFAIVGGDGLVKSMFNRRKYNTRTIAVLNNPDEYDAVVFTGGADISPYLYGQGLHPSTHPDYARDLRELACLRRIPRLKPKIGICRGGQLLNVYSGGSLYQDVDHHRGGAHKAECLLTGKTLMVSSAHHQSMDPTKEAMIMMVSGVATKRSKYEGTETLNPEHQNDIEACFYEHTMSYCFQGHPEYTHAPDSEKYFFQHLDFCFGDLWVHKEKEEEEENPREVRVG